MMPTPAPVTHAAPTPTVTASPTASGLSAADAAVAAVPTPVTFQTQFPVGAAQLAQVTLHRPFASSGSWVCVSSSGPIIFLHIGAGHLPSIHQCDIGIALQHSEWFCCGQAATTRAAPAVSAPAIAAHEDPLTGCVVAACRSRCATTPSP